MSEAEGPDERFAMAAEGKPDFPATPEGWLNPSDVLTFREFQEKIPTGIPSLDRLTRGGLQAGVLCTGQGRPGVGKSTVLFDLGYGYVRDHGAALVALLPDEGPAADSVRLGQKLGFDREKLEALDEKEVVAFIGAVCRLPIWMADTDEHPEITLEKAIAFAQMLREHFDLVVLAVDSTQTVRTEFAEEKSTRERIEYVMDTLYAAARSGLLVLNVSQVGRGSYRSKKASENTEKLAAAAESRAIEYRSTVLLDFEGDPHEAVTVEVVKNRLGRRGSFQLRLDETRASFAEIDVAATIAENDQEAYRRHETEVSKLADRVAALLAKHGALNVSQLHERVGGKKESLLQALDGLEAQAVAEWKRGARGSKVWTLKARS